MSAAAERPNGKNMVMPIDTNSGGQVSSKALSIARIIDRLPPGSYIIRVVKPDDKAGSWPVEVMQPVTLQKKEINTRGPDQRIDL